MHLLHSADGGVTWTHWSQLTLPVGTIATRSVALQRWQDRLALTLVSKRLGNKFEAHFYSLTPADRAPSPISLGTVQSARKLSNCSTLATPDALHMLLTFGNLSTNAAFWTVGLDAQLAPLPIQRFDLPRSQYTFGATPMLDASGEPMIAVAWQEHLNWGKTAYYWSRQLQSPQIPIEIKTPAQLWTWSPSVQLWQRGEGRPRGPHWFTSQSPTPTGGLVLALDASVVARTGSVGYNVDRIALNEGGWTDRWTLDLSTQFRYQPGHPVVLRDGRVAIYTERGSGPGTFPVLVLLITDPLPGIDATETTVGSPAKTP